MNGVFSSTQPISTSPAMPLPAPAKIEKKEKWIGAIANAVLKENSVNPLFSQPPNQIFFLEHSKLNPIVHYASESFRFLLPLLEKWKLKEGRIIELWGVGIYQDLESNVHLKPFATEFAKHFVEAYLFMINLTMDVKISLPYLKEIPFFSNPAKFFQSLKKIIEQRLSQARTMKKGVAKKKKGEIKTEISFYEGLVGKLEMGLKEFASHRILSMNQFLSGASLKDLSSESIQTMLKFTQAKMTLFECGMKQFQVKKQSAVNQLPFPVEPFKEEFHRFTQSLSFPDFNSLINVLGPSQHAIMLNLNAYQELINKMELSILSNKAEPLQTEFEQNQRVVKTQTPLECYFALRQNWAQMKVLHQISCGSLVRIVIENVQPNLFPSAIDYNSVFSRLKEGLSYFSYRPRKLPYLWASLIPSSKFEREELKGLYKELSLPQTFLCTAMFDRMNDEISLISDNLLDVFCKIEKDHRLNRHALVLSLHMLTPLISEMNQMIQSLPERRKNLVTIALKELKKIPLKTLVEDKKIFLESLEDYHLKNQLDFVMFTFLLKDCEWLLNLKNDQYVEEESLLFPDQVLDFLDPFEEAYDLAVAELSKPTIVPAAPSSTLPLAVNPQPSPLIVAVPPSVALQSTSVIATIHSAIPQSFATRVQQKPLLLPSKAVNQDYKAPLKQASPQKNSNSFKIKRGMKIRKLMGKLNELRKQRLDIFLKAGKGSHLMLGIGESVSTLPHAKTIKPYMAKALNLAIQEQLGQK